VHYTRIVRTVLGVANDELTDGRARQYGLASTLAADLGNTMVFPSLLFGGELHVTAPGSRHLIASARA